MAGPRRPAQKPLAVRGARGYRWRMSRWLVAALLLVLPARVFAAEAAPYEEDVQAFEQQLRAQPPADGTVIFMGSSSIHKWWTLAQDLPQFPVVNYGLDGMEIPDCTRFAERLLAPYRSHHPRRVVFYAGDNDVADHAAAEQVLARFQDFVAAARRALPGVPITFVSIKLSPARRELGDYIRRANRLVADFAAAEPDLDFVDVYSLMVDSQGEPRPGLFLKDDGLHMTPAGYAIWREALAPRL